MNEKSSKKTPNSAPMRAVLRVLFMAAGEGWPAYIAAAQLQHLDAKVQVYSAGVKAAGPVPEQVSHLLQKQQIKLVRSRHAQFTDYASFKLDLIVTLDPQAQQNYSAESLSKRDKGRLSIQIENSQNSVERLLHAGMPMYLFWDVFADEPDWQALVPQNRERLQNWQQQQQAEVLQRIKSLSEHGYLNALHIERQRLDRVLDAIDEAVVVHDANRHIYLFNRAAERITGYTREEAIGHDCHEVFGNQGLCGGQCTFRHGPDDREQRDEKSVLFCDREGVHRHLRLAVDTLEREPGQARRVVATFRDVSDEVDLRRELHDRLGFGNMVGSTAPMREVFERIRQVAGSDYPALISGESGVGKELAARAIHDESRRKGGPFVPINCGALPTHILESELFGHVRGAFTGAVRDHKGRFELADGGTLFLDEVGELEPAFQVKLLRVLQEKRFERVGGEKPVSVDVRIISATNLDLRKQVSAGLFSEDLYYRLAVVPIRIPALRERREDIPFLIDKILEDIRKESRQHVDIPSDEAMAHMLAYAWPGNVRELINALRFASVRCNGQRIQLAHLPPEIQKSDMATAHTDSPVLAIDSTPMTTPRAKPGAQQALLRSHKNISLEQIQQAIEQAQGHKGRAAKILGISRATLYRRLGALLDEQGLAP